MTVLLAVLVTAGTAAVIVYPLLRPGPQPTPDPIGPAAERAALEERKLQIYASIRELGFDFNTDKLEEADYEEEVDRLKAEAIEIVRQLDGLGREAPRGSADLEDEIAARRRDLESGTAAAAPGEVAFCTQCGTPAGSDDRFCGSCGHDLRASRG